MDRKRRDSLLPASIHAEQHRARSDPHPEGLEVRRARHAAGCAIPDGGLLVHHAIEGGGLDWLHLIVLICIWNAFKMIAIGPVSIALLV